jgi:hypothetical protein
MVIVGIVVYVVALIVLGPVATVILTYALLPFWLVVTMATRRLPLEVGKRIDAVIGGLIGGMLPAIIAWTVQIFFGVSGTWLLIIAIALIFFAAPKVENRRLAVPSQILGCAIASLFLLHF